MENQETNELQMPCDVAMIQTEKEGVIWKFDASDSLIVAQGTMQSNIPFKKFDLFLTSEREKMVDDYVVAKNSTEKLYIGKVVSVGLEEGKQRTIVVRFNCDTIDATIFYDQCRKIEATTDIKITSDFGTSGNTFVPSIKKSFISEFVESKGEIKRVMVEMEVNDSAEYFIASQFGDFTYRVKTNPDNTVIIHPVKIFSIEEVEQLCIKAWHNGYWHHYEEINGEKSSNEEALSTLNWIKKYFIRIKA